MKSTFDLAYISVHYSKQQGRSQRVKPKSIVLSFCYQMLVALPNGGKFSLKIEFMITQNGGISSKKIIIIIE